MNSQNRNLCCPPPTQWAEIYSKQNKARRKANDPEIPKAPTPLLFVAWDEANMRVMSRWKETLDGADNYGFSHLIHNHETKKHPLDKCHSKMDYNVAPVAE